MEISSIITIAVFVFWYFYENQKEQKIELEKKEIKGILKGIGFDENNHTLFLFQKEVYPIPLNKLFSENELQEIKRIDIGMDMFDGNYSAGLKLAIYRKNEYLKSNSFS